MLKQVISWDDLRHFLALARQGSIRGAGSDLGCSHSTVVRRVEALEARLEVRLFDRHRDGYLLTDAGRALVGRAERIEAEHCELERELLGQDARLAGTITLTCCDTYVSAIVLEGLSAFCCEHPEIELSFITDSRAFDLNKREADLAIRTLARGQSPPEQLMAKAIAPVVIASYRASGVELPGRVISNPEHDLQLKINAMCEQERAPWGSFASVELMAQAARAGLGHVILPTYVGEREPALERSTGPEVHVADLWLLCHPDLKKNARLRAVREQLSELWRTRAVQNQTIVDDG